MRGRVEELMAFRRPVYRETCHRTVDVNGRTVEEIVDADNPQNMSNLQSKKGLENTAYIV